MLPGAAGGAEEELPPEAGGEEEAIEDQLPDLWQRVSVILPGQAGGPMPDLQVRHGVMGSSDHLNNLFVIQGLLTLCEMCYIDTM